MRVVVFGSTKKMGGLDGNRASHPEMPHPSCRSKRDATGELKRDICAAVCLYTEPTSSDSEGRVDERGCRAEGTTSVAARKKDLVLVIGGAMYSSAGNHPLHFLYSRLSEVVLDNIDVVVVDPTTDAEWASKCEHRTRYKVKHEQMDLHSFLDASDPSDLMEQYGRIAVIDDVFFAYNASSDKRLDFLKSSGYMALTRAAEGRPEQFTWWELDRIGNGDPKILQLLFGTDASIKKLSLLLRMQTSNKLLKSKTLEVDLRTLNVERLFQTPS